MNKRNIRHASDRELNALMRIVDSDLTMRGIEHPAPPYIQPHQPKAITWSGFWFLVAFLLIVCACVWLMLLTGHGG